MGACTETADEGLVCECYDGYTGAYCEKEIAKVDETGSDFPKMVNTARYLCSCRKVDNSTSGGRGQGIACLRCRC
nr:hypothetical protein BaRGS_001822 [Batillaria attramentaria]